MIVIDSYWYSLIVVDSHWYSLMSGQPRSHCYLLRSMWGNTGHDTNKSTKPQHCRGRGLVNTICLETQNLGQAGTGTSWFAPQIKNHDLYKLFLESKSLSLCVHPVHIPTLSIWCSVIITISHFRQEIGCCLSAKRFSGIKNCLVVKRPNRGVRLFIKTTLSTISSFTVMSCFYVYNCFLVYRSRRLACVTCGGGRSEAGHCFHLLFSISNLV